MASQLACTLMVTLIKSIPALILIPHYLPFIHFSIFMKQNDLFFSEVRCSFYLIPESKVISKYFILLDTLRFDLTGFEY